MSRRSLAAGMPRVILEGPVPLALGRTEPVDGVISHPFREKREMDGAPKRVEPCPKKPPPPLPLKPPKPAAPVATIATLGKYEGQSVQIRGWLYNSRESGKLLFPIFRDGTGTVQGVAHVKSVPPEVFEALKGLTQESSVIVTGKVRADKRAPGGFELDVEDIEVIQRVPESDPYPITLKEHGVDFLMEHRHLWVRSPRQSAILRIRAEIMRAAAEYFDNNGFIRTDPPILTPAACEGTSTLFPVDYFGDPAYLTQSGQLYIESTALALGKVYSFGPTFRAEKSKTRRHLTEFWMVEPEVAYCDLDGLMELAENFLSHIVQSVVKNRAPELQVIGRDPEKLEEHCAAVSAAALRRSGEDAERGACEGIAGAAIRIRQRLRLAGRDVAEFAVRPAGDGASLSGGGEGVLHGARPEGSRTLRCAWMCWRPRVTAR